MIEPVLRRALRIARGAVASQRQQQHVAAVRQVANASGDLVAVHPGKTDVDDPHVRTLGVQQFQAARAVRRFVDDVSGELEHHSQHLAGVLVVLNQEHASRCRTTVPAALTHRGARSPQESASAGP